MQAVINELMSLGQLQSTQQYKEFWRTGRQQIGAQGDSRETKWCLQSLHTCLKFKWVHSTAKTPVSKSEMQG